MLEDAELVELAKAGDQEALQALFRRYQNRIFSYLFRMLGRKEEAEDAAQETFINAFRTVKRYKEEGRFHSWLFTIAHREGLRMLRKRKRAPLSVSQFEDQRCLDLPDPAPLPSQRVMEKQELEHLEYALRKLSDSEREVVILRLVDDVPFKEVAEITGAPLNTVLGRMHNATKKLRKILERDRVSDEKRS